VTSVSSWLIKFSQKHCKHFRRSHRQDKLTYALQHKIWEPSENFCSHRNHKRDRHAAVSEHYMLLSPEFLSVSTDKFEGLYSASFKKFEAVAFHLFPPHSTVLCQVKNFSYIPSFYVFLVFQDWITLQCYTSHNQFSKSVNIHLSILSHIYFSKSLFSFHTWY